MHEVNKTRRKNTDAVQFVHLAVTGKWVAGEEKGAEEEAGWRGEG